MNISNLNIIFWNARSIRNKYVEMFDFISKNNVDICMLSETWLNNTIKVHHPEYNCVRMDRGVRSGGGIAILIRKTLNYEQINSVKTDLIENVGIEITSFDFTKIKLFSVYFPGGRSCNEDRNKFRNDLRKLVTMSGSYLVCGDLNSRHRDWNCSRANSWGNILSDLTLNIPFVIKSSSNHTYIPASSRSNPSTLDLILTNISSNISHPVALNKLGSDHLPIQFSLSFNGKHKENLIYDYNQTNWKKYSKKVKNSLKDALCNLDLVATVEQIDIDVENFTEIILTSCNTSTPKTIPNKYEFIKIPNFIKNLIKSRNKFRHDWSRFRQESDFLSFKYYEKIVKNEIFAYKNKKWNKQLSKLETRSRPFWNISKAMRKKTPAMPSLNFEGEIYTLNSEKADVLALQFLKNHKIYEIDSNRSSSYLATLHTNSVNELVSQFDNLNPITNPNECIKEEDIDILIRNIHMRKACGHDDIKNIMLKNLPKAGIRFLTFIINACLKLQYFPKSWKSAKVVPIVKPGKDPNQCESYRPISLLSSLSKILEKIINEKLWKFINLNNIIPPEQFGFRQFHSTTHQVKRIVNHVKQNLAVQKSTGLVLLDIEKAFDSVWHNGLIFKLINYGFPICLIKIVKSFLCERYFCVNVNNEYSDLKEIPAGVPQGSVMGPVLYTLFCADLPKSGNCEYAFYADDTGIFISDIFGDNIVNDLQKGLDTVRDYFDKWKIKVNASKTQAIFFTRRRSSCYLPSSKLSMDGHEISWANQVKYLGVFLDPKLNFQCHIQNIIKKCNITIKLMYPIINRKSILSIENKIIIVKVIFQAIILYACPAWESTAKTHIKKLQICQNKLLKMCLKLPWFYSTKKLHEKSHVDLIVTKINKYTNKFRTHCSISDNNYILNLYN